MLIWPVKTGRLGPPVQRQPSGRTLGFSCRQKPPGCDSSPVDCRTALIFNCSSLVPPLGGKLCRLWNIYQLQCELKVPLLDQQSECFPFFSLFLSSVGSKRVGTDVSLCFSGVGSQCVVLVLGEREHKRSTHGHVELAGVSRHYCRNNEMEDVQAARYIRLVFSGGVALNIQIQTVAFMIYSCRTKPWQKEQIRHGAKSNRVAVIAEAKCVSVRWGVEHEKNWSVPKGIPSVSGTTLAISFSQLASRGLRSRRRRTLSSVETETYQPGVKEAAACTNFNLTKVPSLWLGSKRANPGDLSGERVRCLQWSSNKIMRDSVPQLPFQYNDVPLYRIHGQV